MKNVDETESVKAGGRRPAVSTPFLVFLILTLLFMLVNIFFGGFLQPTNERDARRAELESVSGSVKTQLRAIYAKTDARPDPSSEAVFAILDNADGKYVHKVHFGPNQHDRYPEYDSLIVIEMDGHEDVLFHYFNIDSGASSFEWYGDDVED
ncbi:hypothetical protein OAU50_05760 [Planctomycetota bacterium]|nr:hypothetical protein [Planctomycetota bacterium]